MRLHGLLREEEALADLAVHEAVGDELEHLDLAHGRLLLELAERRRERDHLRRGTVRPAGGGSLEPAAVIHVAVQNLPALSGVHGPDIGPPRRLL